jgi:predicted 2-oxoglutarate/Fe(II)-dependent dioxygenase YbiX
MSDQKTGVNRVVLGDPVPLFSAPLVTGGSFDLHVSAGRWVVLSFLGSPSNPRVMVEIDELVRASSSLGEDHVAIGCVLTGQPDDIASLDSASLAALTSNKLFFLADYDGAITRSFGAHEMPRTVVLDPMLRAVADIPWDFPAGHAKTIRNVLAGLPAVDDAAGVPLTAPVLIVPRILDFQLCDFLVEFYDKLGGSDSGFLLDKEGQTSTVVDYRLKRRNDLSVLHPQVRDAIRGQIVRRLLPAIDRFFQFQATRMDRYIVACYDSATGGHFYRHRDNVNAGSQHRRFAVTINLNGDYDGGDLSFPEFGSRAYRAPHGGAVVFSCGALHQVTPMTRGKRYAFLAFLYGEADARLRELNNAKIAQSEFRYSGGESDRLFPGLERKPEDGQGPEQAPEREPERRAG